MAGHQFALVLCSPLSRARETCALAGLDSVTQITSDLCEWNYGVYEGRRTADIQQEIPDWSIWTKGVIDGEGVTDVGKRADRVITAALAAKGDVALFAHGHMLRILGACWLGMHPSAAQYLSLDTASISVLGYERETRVIRTWNQDWHLVPDTTL